MHPPNSQNVSYKKRVRWLVVFPVLFVTVIVVSSLLLTLFLDSFRIPIGVGISHATGLNVTIDSIGLSFSHNLGLRCGGITVSSAGGKKELFSAEKLFLELEVSPLLHKQIIVKSSTLVGLTIPIYLDETFKPAKTVPPAEKPSLDNSSGVPTLHKTVQSSLEILRTFIKNTGLTLNNISVEKGKILLLQGEPPNVPTEKNTLNVDLTLKIVHTNQDRVDLAAKPILRIGKLKITGDLGINDALDQSASFRASFKSDSFDDSDLYQLRELMPKTLRQTIEQKKFSGKFTLTSLNLDTLPATNLGSLISHAKVQFTALVDDGALTLDHVVVPFPHADLAGTWGNNHLTVTGNTRGGNFSVAGDMSADSDDMIDPNIKLSNIHLDNIKTPSELMLSDSILSGNLHSSGPGLWQGEFGVKKLVLGTPEKKQSAETATISLKTQPGKTDLNVKLNHILFGAMRFKQALGDFEISEGKIQLTQGKILPEHGQLDLTGVYYPVTQKYNVKFTGKKLLAEDIMPEYFRGPVSIGGNLNQDKHPKTPLRGLFGIVRINFTDGVLRQPGTYSGLFTLLNPNSMFTGQEQGLNYSHLGGDFKIDKGFVITDNFELIGPQLKLQAVGKADLLTENLKGEIKAIPSQLVDAVVKLIPMLEKILKAKGEARETYFNVEGTLSNPQFALLPRKYLLGKTAKALDDLIVLPGPPLTSKTNSKS